MASFRGETIEVFLKYTKSLVNADLFWANFTKVAFTNYVYKKRGVGGQKNRLFVNIYTIENVNGGG